MKTGFIVQSALNIIEHIPNDLQKTDKPGTVVHLTVIFECQHLFRDVEIALQFFLKPCKTAVIFGNTCQKGFKMNFNRCTVIYTDNNGNRNRFIGIKLLYLSLFDKGYKEKNQRQGKGCDKS